MIISFSMIDADADDCWKCKFMFFMFLLSLLNLDKINYFTIHLSFSDYPHVHSSLKVDIEVVLASD